MPSDSSNPNRFTESDGGEELLTIDLGASDLGASGKLRNVPPVTAGIRRPAVQPEFTRASLVRTYQPITEVPGRAWYGESQTTTSGR